MPIFFCYWLKFNFCHFSTFQNSVNSNGAIQQISHGHQISNLSDLQYSDYYPAFVKPSSQYAKQFANYNTTNSSSSQKSNSQYHSTNLPLPGSGSHYSTFNGSSKSSFHSPSLDSSSSPPINNSHCSSTNSSASSTSSSDVIAFSKTQMSSKDSQKHVKSEVFHINELNQQHYLSSEPVNMSSSSKSANNLMNDYTISSNSSSETSRLYVEAVAAAYGPLAHTAASSRIITTA